MKYCSVVSSERYEDCQAVITTDMCPYPGANNLRNLTRPRKNVIFNVTTVGVASRNNYIAAKRRSFVTLESHLKHFCQ